jgi:hypothetical protein
MSIRPQGTHASDRAWHGGDAFTEQGSGAGTRIMSCTHALCILSELRVLGF